MLLTIGIGATPPSIACLLLPRFGIYDFNWLGPATELLWIPPIAYSIIRYRQMNVRAVITEVLAIAMAAIFFMNIFIDIPFGILARIATFAAFMVLAIYLIRSIMRESAQRDELDELNRTLEDRVAAQTIEIRRSYDAEKQARIDLERLNDAKDQFIMITQHHLRSPATGVVWTIESTLKGAFGSVPAGVCEALSGALESGRRLIGIIDDFLGITTIKAGSSILSLSSASLFPVIESVIDELRSEAQRMNISIDAPRDAALWPALRIDAGKMREALLIVMENAVRYNRPNGSISISASSNDDLFTVTVENTGIGIDAEEAQKIGSSLFFRGSDAKKNNPIGMGIGLSVAKAVLKAHHGSLEIESKGKDMGARAIIRIPKQGSAAHLN